MVWNAFCFVIIPSFARVARTHCYYLLRQNQVCSGRDAPIPGATLRKIDWENSLRKEINLNKMASV